jgi:hypothetical protein
LADLILKFVSVTELPIFWQLSEGFIFQGLATGQGEANVDHIYKDLLAGRAQLIIGLEGTSKVHAALVVQFLQMPNYVVAHVHSIGGQGVIDSAHHWASIKTWMKASGAAKVQGTCLKAQARLWRKLGFESVYEVVRQDL